MPLSTSDICAIMAKRGMFTTLPAHECRELISRARQVTFAPHEVIFHHGDPAGWMYVLLNGRVVTRTNGIDVRVLKPGEVGGVTSCLDTALPRSMTHAVFGSEPATLLRVDAVVYQKMLTNQPFALCVLHHMNTRLRKKTHVLAALRARSFAASLERGKGSGDSSATEAAEIAVFDTKPYDREYLDAAFADQRGMRLHYIDAKLSEETAPLAAGASAVCIFVNDKCNARILALLKTIGVSLVLLRCAGFNNVDLAAAEDLGVDVARVPAYSPHAVAEHAFALLMTVNRNTHRAHDRVRDGNFSLAGLEGRELNGLKVGIAGTGKIGQCFAALAKGCGMQVYAWDVYPNRKWADETGATYVPDFATLAKMSDVLSMHVPLTPQTHHIVNADVLRTMPKGAIIVNTSRGATIDTKALLEALVTKRIGAAGLDVYEEESEYFFEDRSNSPIRDDVLARLINLPNVVVTSHQAFLTNTALTAIASTTCRNAVEFIADGKRGRALTNAVHRPKNKL